MVKKYTDGEIRVLQYRLDLLCEVQLLPLLGMVFGFGTALATIYGIVGSIKGDANVLLTGIGVVLMVISILFIGHNYVKLRNLTREITC